MTDEQQSAVGASLFSPAAEGVHRRSGEAERDHSHHAAQDDAPTRVLHDLLAERVRRLTADAAEPLTPTDFRTVVDLCTPGLAEAKGAARHLGCEPRDGAGRAEAGVPEAGPAGALPWGPAALGTARDGARRARPEDAVTLHPTRPGVFVDRTGERYGRLVVLRRADASPNGVMWLCQCDCGRTKAVLARHLAAGVIQSCGCGRGKPTGLRGKGKHRDRATASSWQAMWDRCTHSYHPAFNRYGGRGITVCDRWRSFENFLADMGPRPPGLSLDRINNDGNYEPGNCRWATQRQQRDNAEGKKRLLTHRGETLRLKEWARRTGLGTTTLRARLQRGWSVERTLETPLLGGGSR